MKKLELSSLRSQLGGMGEWGNGMASFGQIDAYYSISPVWNMQNGWLGIPYYQ